MDEEYVYEEPPEIQIIITPRVQAALDELRAMIATHYPEAAFSVYTWYESAGIYLSATIDTDDIDEVRDVFKDRLLDIQVEEGIPVYVDVRQPPERARAQARAIQEEQWQARKNFESLPDRIVQDPSILGGNPVIKGTQIRVEMVLAHLARFADFDEVLAHYPEITMDDVKACLAVAQSLVAAAPRQEAVATPATR
ncbi:MAG: DUF433 domain-containing protein [Thermomicrobiales bacterium]